jgi:hypothetical protein
MHEWRAVDLGDKKKNGSRREGKEVAKNLSLGGRIKCWF